VAYPPVFAASAPAQMLAASITGGLSRCCVARSSHTSQPAYAPLQQHARRALAAAAPLPVAAAPASAPCACAPAATCSSIARRPHSHPASALAAVGSSSGSSSAAPTLDQRPGGPPSGEGGPPRVRRMILLRHADSETGGSTRDHERPISDHGRQEARSIARQLRDLGWAPDLIIGALSFRDG